jgi:site-specific DNA-methyltransferase (adenine-specific)
MRMLPRNMILTGDAAAKLRSLPTGSVDCVVTSPPYYGLRDYGVAGQLGLEPCVDEWVNELHLVLTDVGRVLKPKGSLWLNLGDSFSRHLRYGAPPKSLLLAPERLLLALARDGWIVRNKLVWWKPNAMPTSVSDRLNLTYDVVYFLTRGPRYFFDLDAIREPHRTLGKPRATTSDGHERALGPLAANRRGLDELHAVGAVGHPRGKNPGDVWSIGTRGYRGAHFATFPPRLVERPILAACPEAVCTSCGEAWRRARVVRRSSSTVPTPDTGRIRRYAKAWQTTVQRGELVPCGCGAPTRPGVVLDPFFGTGTVGVVAERFGRDWIGIELNPKYAAMAEERIAKARAPDLAKEQLRQAA